MSLDEILAFLETGGMITPCFELVKPNDPLVYGDITKDQLTALVKSGKVQLKENNEPGFASRKVVVFRGRVVSVN